MKRFATVPMQQPFGQLSVTWFRGMRHLGSAHSALQPHLLTWPLASEAWFHGMKGFGETFRSAQLDLVSWHEASSRFTALGREPAMMADGSFEEDFARRRRRRGGHLQRAAFEHSVVVDATVSIGTGKLANLLLEKWSWGELSARQVQLFAAAAVADGSTHIDLMSLAAIGGQGQISGNARRDLVRKLPGNQLPNAYEWRLPICRRKGADVGVVW